MNDIKDTLSIYGVIEKFVNSEKHFFRRNTRNSYLFEKIFQARHSSMLAWNIYGKFTWQLKFFCDECVFADHSFFHWPTNHLPQR